MNNFLHKISLLILLVIFWGGVNAEANNCLIDGNYYILNHENKTLIAAYAASKYESGIFIPSKIVESNTEYTEKSIGIKAFYFCTFLTSISILESVTSFRYDAFHNYGSLTSINFPRVLVKRYFPITVRSLQSRAITLSSTAGSITADTAGKPTMGDS